jgi:23S rRNA (adenine2503-C2)-methyltransferase
VTDFAAMTSIAGPLRAKLAERFVVSRPEAATVQTSRDETRKFLFRFRDGQQVETVYIPDLEEDRGAVCISTQVGCTLSCRFCHTARRSWCATWVRQEIVGQFMAARDSYGEWPSPKDDKPRLLSTIVVMGMGEPLYNYENTAKALRIVMDHEGIGLSRRRITLSTSGVVPMMDRCGEELGVNLAVSLHAVTDELRDEIVPLNRKYPIAELLAACRRYPGAPTPAHHLRVRHAARRERLGGRGAGAGAPDPRHPGEGEPDPFNPWPGAPYKTSRPDQVRRFAEIVQAAGYASPIRRPRGRDILAACGQLKTESERAKRARPAA